MAGLSCTLCTSVPFVLLLHQAVYLIRGGESKVILGQVDLPVSSSKFKSKDIKKKVIISWMSPISLTSKF